MCFLATFSALQVAKSRKQPIIKDEVRYEEVAF